MKKGFSKGQQWKYRPLVERAWQAECFRSGTKPGCDGARETWYRRQLLDTCGIYTTKQADPINDYDKLMLHFAIIAGDQNLIDYFSCASERRHLHNIRRSIAQGVVTEAYVQGIARNMGFREDLDSLPADHLWRIWNALIRHNKRHDPGFAKGSAVARQEQVLASA